MVAAKRWLWVREMVAVEVVAGVRDGGGDGSDVGDIRERGENFKRNWFLLFSLCLDPLFWECILENAFSRIHSLECILLKLKIVCLIKY